MAALALAQQAREQLDMVFTDVQLPEADPVHIWGQTEWRYCMRKGDPTFHAHGFPDPQLDITYSLYRQELPLHVQKTGAMPQPSFEYAARQLKSAFGLHLWKPVIPRIKRLARCWLAKSKEAKPELFAATTPGRLMAGIQRGGIHLDSRQAYQRDRYKKSLWPRAGGTPG